MTWPGVRLSNVLSLEYGASLPAHKREADGTIPVAGSNGISGYHSESMVPGPGIVVGRKGSAGKVVWYDSDFWPIDTTYYVVPRAGVDLRWAFYLLQHLRLERLAIVTGVPGLNRDDAYSLRVRLPPPSEQRRIVEILDQADALRRLRAEADAKTQRILPALFLSMFGDPAANRMGWPIHSIRWVASKMSDGPFGSNLKSEHYEPTGVRVFRLQNVGLGVLDDRDRSYISLDHFQKLSKHKCKPGDVIVGTLGDPNLRAFVQPEHVSMAINKADCVQVRVNSLRATPEWLCWLLNMPGTFVIANRLVTGQSRTRISMGRLRDMDIPVPPLDSQQEFSSFVKKIENVLCRKQNARHVVERLGQAITHRAFSGELTAKWREAHHEQLCAEMAEQAKLLNLPVPEAATAHA